MLRNFVILHLALVVRLEVALVALYLLVLLELVDGELHFKWSFVATVSTTELDRSVLHHLVLPQDYLSLRLVGTIITSKFEVRSFLSNVMDFTQMIGIAPVTHYLPTVRTFFLFVTRIDVLEFMSV